MKNYLKKTSVLDKIKRGQHNQIKLEFLITSNARILVSLIDLNFCKGLFLNENCGNYVSVEVSSFEKLAIFSH